MFNYVSFACSAEFVQCSFNYRKVRVRKGKKFVLTDNRVFSSKSTGQAMAEAAVLSGNEISKWVKFDKMKFFKILSFID